MSTPELENKRWNGGPQRLEFRHTAARELVTSGPVLDVGSGDGLFLELLKDKSISGEGVDFSSAGQSHSRARGIQVTQCDLTREALPFADKSFTTVTALDVLEHVYEPGTLLTEVARVASRDVIVSVPNFSSLPARLQVLCGDVPENNRPHKLHVYWFTWTGLISLASGAGLRVDTLKVNAPLESRFLLGPLMKKLAHLWPSVFALSFVVRFTKEP